MKKKLILAAIAALTLSFSVGCGAADDLSASGDASANAGSADATVIEKVEYDPLDYVELGDYKNLTVEATKYMVFDSDVEAYVEQVLSSAAYHKEVTDRTVVENGDYINIDYTLYVGEEEKQSNSLSFEVGNSSMIAGFDEEMIGQEVGKEFAFDIAFPDDYVDSSLVGADTNFKVTVTAIKEADTTIPELTDEWVEETFKDSMDITTVEEMKNSVREFLQQQADSNTEQSMLSAVQAALYECCTVTGIPNGLVEEKAAEYEAADKAAAETNGYEFEDYIKSAYGYSSVEDYEADLKESMESFVQQLLIRQAIIKTENWVVNDELIDQFLAQYANYYSYESFDEFLSAFGAAYGFDTKEGFIDYIGEDSINDAALTLKLWDEIESMVKVNYIEEVEEGTEASGDASADALTSAE